MSEPLPSKEQLDDTIKIQRLTQAMVEAGALELARMSGARNIHEMIVVEDGSRREFWTFFTDKSEACLRAALSAQGWSGGG